MSFAGGELSQELEEHIVAHWSAVMGDGYLVKVAQLSKFKEGGGLGISLEGTVDVENGVERHPHHYIRSVLTDGPVGQNGRLQSGDELLEVSAVCASISSLTGAAGERSSSVGSESHRSGWHPEGAAQGCAHRVWPSGGGPCCSNVGLCTLFPQPPSV